MRGNRLVITLSLVLALPLGLALAADPPVPEGGHPYEAFESPQACATCHVDIARQHEQAMMSQSYTHHWDEIEYFELAVPHAEKEPKVAEVKAGCNGCHAPLALLAGDVPPPPPAEGSRANESVSCDLCHTDHRRRGTRSRSTSTGSLTRATRSRASAAEWRARTTSRREANRSYRTAEFCGTCHNEKDPWGLWVKATHLEWKEGPHGKAGIVCQDCHMPPAAGPLGRDGRGARRHPPASVPRRARSRASSPA